MLCLGRSRSRGFPEGRGSISCRNLTEPLRRRSGRGSSPVSRSRILVSPGEGGWFAVEQNVLVVSVRIESALCSQVIVLSSPLKSYPSYPSCPLRGLTNAVSSTYVLVSAIRCGILS